MSSILLEDMEEPWKPCDRSYPRNGFHSWGGASGLVNTALRASSPHLKVSQIWMYFLIVGHRSYQAVLAFTAGIPLGRAAGRSLGREARDASGRGKQTYLGLQPGQRIRVWLCLRQAPHGPERRRELAAAIPISSCAISIQLSRGCLLIALPSTTLFDLPQLWNVLLGDMSWPDRAPLFRTRRRNMPNISAVD